MRKQEKMAANSKFASNAVSKTDQWLAGTAHQVPVNATIADPSITVVDEVLLFREGRTNMKPGFLGKMFLGASGVS